MQWGMRKALRIVCYKCCLLIFISRWRKTKLVLLTTQRKLSWYYLSCSSSGRRSISYWAANRLRCSGSSWQEPRSPTSSCCPWWPAVWRTVWPPPSWPPLTPHRSWHHSHPSDFTLFSSFLNFFRCQNSRFCYWQLRSIIKESLLLTNVVFADWDIGRPWVRRTWSGGDRESQTRTEGRTPHYWGSVCQVRVHH